MHLHLFLYLFASGNSCKVHKKIKKTLKKYQNYYNNVSKEQKTSKWLQSKSPWVIAAFIFFSSYFAYIFLGYRRKSSDILGFASDIHGLLHGCGSFSEFFRGLGDFFGKSECVGTRISRENRPSRIKNVGKTSASVQ